MECRPVTLHAAFEKEVLGSLLVVTEDSAALSVSNMAVSPIVRSELARSEIAKPPSENLIVYKQVLDRVGQEMTKLSNWRHIGGDATSVNIAPCLEMSFRPE